MHKPTFNLSWIQNFNRNVATLRANYSMMSTQSYASRDILFYESQQILNKTREGKPWATQRHSDITVKCSKCIAQICFVIFYFDKTTLSFLKELQDWNSTFVHRYSPVLPGTNMSWISPLFLSWKRCFGSHHTSCCLRSHDSRDKDPAGVGDQINTQSLWAVFIQ